MYVLFYCFDLLLLYAQFVFRAHALLKFSLAEGKANSVVQTTVREDAEQPAAVGVIGDMEGDARVRRSTATASCILSSNPPT